MRSIPENKLSPAAIKAWRFTISCWCFLLLMIPVMMGVYNWYSLQVADFSELLIVGLAILVLFVSVLLIVFVPKIRWQQWYYHIDEQEIDLQHGIIIITRTLVPLKRVQHVDTRQGPILRNFDLADVTISTAATTHRIPALDEETAETVRNRISKYARLAKEDV